MGPLCRAPGPRCSLSLCQSIIKVMSRGMLVGFLCFMHPSQNSGPVCKYPKYHQAPHLPPTSEEQSLLVASRGCRGKALDFPTPSASGQGRGDPLTLHDALPAPDLAKTPGIHGAGPPGAG